MSNKIFIIDDDIQSSKVWARWLEETGFYVTVINDSGTAPETIEKEKPDLIMMDVLMPQQDGMTLARQIRSSPITGHIPIIMMSAVYKDRTSKVQLQMISDDFLDKPFEKDMLMLKIQKFLTIPENVPPRKPEPPKGTKSDLAILEELENLDRIFKK